MDLMIQCDLQAFIIGWTSDFIPKMVYKYTHGQRQLDGYMNWSLSYFKTADFESRSLPDFTPAEFGNVTVCR